MPDSAGVLDIERGKQADTRALPWQSDDAVSYNSWGYVKVPDWYRDAKFGIFIHWGVYAVPAYGGGGIFGE